MSAIRPSSATIVLLPSRSDLERLGNSRADDPTKGLHISLWWVGEAGPDLYPTKAHIVNALQHVSGSIPPIKATVLGVSLFGDDSPKASVLVLSKAAISLARTAVKASLPDIPTQKYPFTPHITLGYGIPTQIQHVGAKMTIDRISIWFGDDEPVTFPLGLQGMRVDL